MTALAKEKNSLEKREKRAKSIAAMGLVNREGSKFMVLTPSLRGKQTSYEVWRDPAGKIRCSCLEFEEATVNNSGFRCEHILAVKYALIEKNTEPAIKPTASEKTTSPKPVSGIETKANKAESSSGAEKNRTELKNSETPDSNSAVGMSEDGEQKSAENQADVLENGQTKAIKADDRQPTNTKGDEKMPSESLKEIPFVTAEEAANIKVRPDNVLDFKLTLKELRKNVDPHLVKQREGWRDSQGNAHYVDYVEWHTVADILDEHAPNWSHTVKDMRQIGNIFTVTVAITIDGVTREGIGTGIADSELGIKKAEHDALKRAAVKFGIARELYKKESDVIERDGAVPLPDGGFPQNPIARSLSDLVTTKQLGMIRAISREIGIDADEECQTLMQCKTDELSKRAASALIQHLQDLQKQRKVEANSPMRRAG